METKEQILQRGWEWIDKVHGEVGRDVLKKLSETAPELTNFIVGFGYGEVYSSAQMPIQKRQILVVAGLTAMNNAPTQLRVHIRATLNVGCTVAQIKEAILQVSVYAGIPAAMNAMMQLKLALEERKLAGCQDEIDGVELPNGNYSTEEGKAIMNQLVPGQTDKMDKMLGDLAPEILHYTYQYAFGEIIRRDVLSLAEREMIIVATLICSGAAEHQLKWHLQAAINAGNSVEDLKDAIYMMILYSGFPSAMNAIRLLREIMENQ